MNKYLIFFSYKRKMQGLGSHNSRHIVLNTESFPNKHFILDRIQDENPDYLEIHITGITNITNEDFEYWES